MKKNTKKVKNLLESLPYIEKFRNKIFVFKYGGSLLTDIDRRKSFIDDLILLKHLNMKVVIVHGGGKAISKRLDEKGIKSEFYKGYRITDDNVIVEAEMVLSGQINKKLTLDFVKKDVKAIGISGKDSGLIKAKKKIIDKSVDIGHVGEVEKINNEFLKILIDKDYIPIISPISFGKDGESYNINADDVASEIAISLKAEKLFFISDIRGLYKDFDDKNSFISSIDIKEAKGLIKEKIIKGGMLPKLKSCINSVENGTKAVHIIDGRIEHAILLEIFTDSGVGTMVKGEKYEFDESV